MKIPNRIFGYRVPEFHSKEIVATDSTAPQLDVATNRFGVSRVFKNGAVASAGEYTTSVVSATGRTLVYPAGASVGDKYIVEFAQKRIFTSA